MLCFCFSSLIAISRSEMVSFLVLFQGMKQYVFSFISGVEIVQILVLFQGWIGAISGTETIHF